ncbi:MAG: helix-turn-helix domain-containing protein [Klebsiella pneumoniae]|nr:helix-turn-helix domain-containing protein [Klebsiella pneumoniae]MDU4371922.1 helix-turn-helix domain-containing protein [Klebsiella pneumoniae]MDW5940758.1 helix-turn-helix domain-containing protein [Klebsiella pneumoniae]MDW6114995.1 helix-turn-helix domain-containing protein [Klebsiella pneumoniae]
MNVTSPKMLAQVLRNARKQRKLTQREAAESMCMKQSTVSEFVNHPEGTRLDTLFKLLAALDLKLQVVSRKGENKSSKTNRLIAGTWSGEISFYYQRDSWKEPVLVPFLFRCR